MNSSEIRIAIAGVTGRMGKALIKATQQSNGVCLGAALVRGSSPWIGRDVGELAGIGITGIKMSDNPNAVVNDFDVLIDFTRPQGTLAYLSFCRQHHKAIVIGTTGLDEAGKTTIKQASDDIGIVFAANFSVGVNVMLKLLGKTAKVMGDYADIEIIEAHHRHKVDAPSGTALAMGEAIADALHWDFKQHAVYAREGFTGERAAQSIGFATIRAGDIVGEHTALFADNSERLEITHKADNRMTFANGAIRAAKWVNRYKTGLFDMRDVLDLQNL